MSGVRDGRGPPGPARDAADFPFTRDIGPARLVVANSSPPTAPGLASGALGARQIEAIERDLNRAAEDQRFAILMLHHPINDGVVSRRKALDDRAALAAAIGRAGVDLVLHGHAHVAHFGAVATPHGAAPVIGGAAASHPRAGGKYAPGRYNHFRLQKTPEGVRRLDLAVREFDPRTGAAQTVMTRSFEGGEAKMRAKA
jgi:3',5'-cyclic AMP phosphodiesterase CpdA